MAVAVRTAEAAITALIRTRLAHSQRLMQQAGLLLDHTATLRTDMIAVMRQSAEIMRRSRHLAPRAIQGRTDDAELLMGVMAGAALCAPCISKRINIPLRAVETLLLSVGRTVLIDIGGTVCDACKTASMCIGWREHRYEPGASGQVQRRDARIELRAKLQPNALAAPPLPASTLFAILKVDGVPSRAIAAIVKHVANGR